MPASADVPRHGLLRAGLAIEELPAALAGLLTELRHEGLTCEAFARSLAEIWHIPEPHRAAAIAVAQEADRSGTLNSYHNPAHSRDVALNWANLAELNARLATEGQDVLVLGPADLGLGLCAAFGHDLLHDGVGNFAPAGVEGGGSAIGRAKIPFRLESVAADRASTLMTSCGMKPSLVEPVVASILATDPVEGFAALSETGPGSLDARFHTSLRSLHHSPWRMMALLLRDADLLASVGLTGAEHDRQSALLSLEVGIDFNTPDAAELLFETAAAERFGSPAGRLFLPQFHALRALNPLRRRAAGWLSLAESARRVAGA